MLFVCVCVCTGCSIQHLMKQTVNKWLLAHIPVGEHGFSRILSNSVHRFRSRKWFHFRFRSTATNGLRNDIERCTPPLLPPHSALMPTVSLPLPSAPPSPPPSSQPPPPLSGTPPPPLHPLLASAAFHQDSEAGVGRSSEESVHSDPHLWSGSPSPPRAHDGAQGRGPHRDCGEVGDRVE
jgi:hypothetical protein